MSEPPSPLAEAPFFTAHIFACNNQRPEGHHRGSCARRGAEALRNYMKVRAKELGLAGVRVNQAGCLDRCELGPVMVIYPEGVWYTVHTTADVDEILSRHVAGGEPVARLRLANDATVPAGG